MMRVTIEGIETLGESCVIAKCLLPSLVRQCHGIWESDVGERIRLGVWHGTGHVGYAVEQ